MKKTFKYYAIIWASLLAVYNLVVFLVRPLPGYVINYDARFWVSWVIVNATFAGQLFCAKVAFNSKNNEKFFLNLPLITKSYKSLVLMTIVASALMLIPDCPAWIASVVCAIVFGFNAMSIVKAKSAADMVSETNDKTKAQTFFIKSLTVDAETLMARAKSEAIKAECKKVYEAVRYSDPMSNDALTSVESEIIIKFAKFADAVNEENAEASAETAKEVVILVENRNKKCKALK